jgi:hypothetical protein
MLLNWNEVRARAAKFAAEWSDAHYEKGETQTFYNEFFEVFGVRRRQVATFEEPVKRLGEKRGFIDLFWKGVLLVEQKSAGENLIKAKEQALDYFPKLKEYEAPRYILISDFQTFELYDLDEDHETHFQLADLPKHVEAFGFILGIQKRTFKDQDPVNIEASELMGRLHDALKASGYTGHELERFLVRLLFCLFADDTGIFEPRGILLELLTNRTREDGSDTGQWLHNLFEILDIPPERRQSTLDEDLARFSYVDGDLFKERLLTPAFDANMRKLLIEACTFSWDAISPAIFGSLFQSVMDRDQRRALGAHYTTEKNILKVIEPLFLDDLRKEFARLKGRRDNRRAGELKAFHDRLGQLRFFDPACGCGNFLIIAYRELRELELEVLKLLYPSGQLRTDARSLSKIDVDQFYGIEIEEFPARIAEVALWMMDHIMNNRLSLAFGLVFTRIPLRASPHIRNADALEIEWSDVIEPKTCSYVFGNPPFGGAKYQTPKQREQVRRIAQLGGSGGTLDYVSAWYLKAGAYLQDSPAAVGFVATNSITQGEQVAQLWPLLFDRHKLEIAFAHRTFAWGSDARGRARVHVVIIGLYRRDWVPAVKRLFSYENVNGEPLESAHKFITPYLFDGSTLQHPHLVVRENNQPLDKRLPKLIIGSKPIDGGHYIFTGEEKDTFLEQEPDAERLMHPYVGSREYLNGGDRWILCFKDVPPELLKRMPRVRERIAAVREYRVKSDSKPTQELASMPLLYHVNVVPEVPFLAIPKVSSERREYVPIGWMEPPTIPSDLLFVLMDANMPLFAILTSAMHMAWLRHIGGRLESRYRYSIGLVYNTFPLPPVSELELSQLEPMARAVLDVRDAHPTAEPADLYDPDLMPTDLRRAHQTIDRAVDRLYRRSGFASERERIEHLFGLYEKLVAPLTAQPKTTRRATLRSKSAIPAPTLEAPLPDQQRGKPGER